jgi:hypothetical protein
MIKVKKRLERVLSILLLLILFTILVWAAVPTLTFNAPANASATANNWTLLNITVEDSDGNTLDVKIYGANESTVSNKSLIYRQSVVSGANITYNWTAPKQNVTSDVVLLMYFDNQTKEWNLSELANGSGTVLLMHFNNDSSYGENNTHVYDFSGNNNGTVYGGALPNATGRLGNAYNFDGVDDYINVTNDTSLNFGTGNFSVSVWIKTTDLNYRDLVAKWADADWNGWSIGYVDTGLPYFYLQEEGDGVDVDGTTNIVDDNWHHIAGVREGLTIKISIKL